MLAVALSLLVLAMFALLIGAFYLYRFRGERGRPLLMGLLAFVMLVNLAIWTLPDDSGVAPVTAIEDR